MKKKILGIISLVFLFVFSVALSANAIMFEKSDVETAQIKLNTLANYDLIGMVSKNQLIGNRYDGFRMATFQYQKTASAAASTLSSIVDRINLVDNSIELTNTEKNMQKSRLYQEADAAVSKVVSDTMTYLIGLQNIMPTLTYRNYVKSFKEYYSSLNISSQQLYVY